MFAHEKWMCHEGSAFSICRFLWRRDPLLWTKREQNTGTNVQCRAREICRSGPPNLGHDLRHLRRNYSSHFFFQTEPAFTRRHLWKNTPARFRVLSTLVFFTEDARLVAGLPLLTWGSSFFISRFKNKMPSPKLGCLTLSFFYRHAPPYLNA